MLGLCSSPALWWASVFCEALPRALAVMFPKVPHVTALNIQVFWCGKRYRENDWNLNLHVQERRCEGRTERSSILSVFIHVYFRMISTDIQGWGRLCVLCREQAPIWGCLLFPPLVATESDKYNFYLNHTGIRLLFPSFYLWLEPRDKNFTCTTVLIILENKAIFTFIHYTVSLYFWRCLQNHFE